MGSLHAHLSRFHPIFEAQDLGNLKPGTTEKKTGDIPETGDISKEGQERTAIKFTAMTL